MEARRAVVCLLCIASFVLLESLVENSTLRRQNPASSRAETDAKGRNGTSSFARSEKAASFLDWSDIPPPTIVAQLGGEMGNNIGYYLSGYSLQKWLQQHYNMTAKIIVRHQDSSKWIRGQEAINSCLPKLQDVDFEEGNRLWPDGSFLDKQFANLTMQGMDWRGMDTAGFTNRTSYEENLHAFVRHYRASHALLFDNNTEVRKPLLISRQMVYLYNHLMDEYYDDFRELLQWKESTCCKQLPDPDESVFVSTNLDSTPISHPNFQHFRNYKTEMPRKHKVPTYRELGPNQTVSELFAHLKEGDRVAITTRFRNDIVQEYVNALSRRGIKTRVVVQTRDVYDFCFLMHAKKELVGIAASTFLIWAGIMGNADVVRAYTIEEKQALSWRHPGLQRFRFERYIYWEEDT